MKPGSSKPGSSKEGAEKKGWGKKAQAFPQVVGLFSSELLFHQVAFLLEGAGFRISRHDPRPSALPTIEEGPIVAQAGTLESLGYSASILRNRMDLGPWVFVAHEEDPPQEQQSVVFLVPGHTSDFLNEVRSSWIAATALRFSRRAREKEGLHLGISVAIARIVAPGLTGKILSGESMNRPLQPQHQGLLAWLGREVGMSSDHLSRLARRGGVSLSAIWDGWRIVLAIILRLEYGSWERAAFHLGFKGASSLTSLSHRTLGSSPRALEREPCAGLARANKHLFSLLTDSTHVGKLETKGDRLT